MLWYNDILQDGEVWTFTVRAFDSSRPARTISVSYDGFAEGKCDYVLQYKE